MSIFICMYLLTKDIKCPEQVNIYGFPNHFQSKMDNSMYKGRMACDLLLRVDLFLF